MVRAPAAPLKLPLHQVVLIVALANLSYFGVEFMAARRIGSVSLFADSIDFLEDACLNLLILVALSWNAKNRARLGMALAGLLPVPAIEFGITAWHKLHSMAAPSPLALSLTGLGALAVNFGCALLLAGHRYRSGSLTNAAFLSSRNDVAANVAILAASGISVIWRSGWPDMLVGVGIAWMNADAAWKILKAARRENSVAAA
ncbi:MAG: cation diffusion facilitator family transporter [Acidobacteriaceae bacterium]